MFHNGDTAEWGSQEVLRGSVTSADFEHLIDKIEELRDKQTPSRKDWHKNRDLQAEVECEIASDLITNCNLDLVKDDRGWVVKKHEKCFPLQAKAEGENE